ncbi:MAG: COX15/CtaA family protein [Acidimicrobiales bacterium]
MRRRISPERYRAITVVALVALAVIIVTGAAVRLTGSGLGCSDWPSCEEDQFHADLEYHALIEFVNRLITGIVSIAVIAAVLGSLARRPRRRDLTLWSLGLVAGVLGQIVLGGLVVIYHLTPWLVISHFLLSIVLIWNAVVLHHRSGIPDHLADGAHRPRDGHGPAQVRLVRLTSLLTLGAVVTGTIVTGSGPHGGDEDVERLGFDVPDVARIHGSTVVALCLVAIGLAVVLRREGASAEQITRSNTVLAVIVAQAAIGYVQYFNDVPVLLVGFHVAGSVALVTVVLRLHLAVAGFDPGDVDGPDPGDADGDTADTTPAPALR